MAAAPAADLIRYLRRQLDQPSLEFAEPPQPISGGFDTRIFGFRLTAAPPAAAGPLILRLQGAHHDPRRVLRERATQNAVAAQGYPAPRVLCASADPIPLGGAFLVMERLPGERLLDARRLGIASVLVDMQMRLHALDPDVLWRALDADAPAIARDVMTFGGYLRRLAARVDDGALDGLRPAMRWLLDHRPPEPAPLSICHGDFHPHNLLYARRAVTGVLDWPNTLVADPLYDVASTLMIVRHTPSELWGLSGPLRWIAAAARQCLVRMYLARFRRRRQLDWAHLSYYEAANAMRWLVQAALHRLQRDAPVHTLDDSSFAERLAERFAEVTGIALVLPAPRR